MPIARTTWDSFADGTSCGSDGVCSFGNCTSGCYIDGTLYSAGASNPSQANADGDVCQTCQPDVNTAGWSDLPDGTGCGIVNGGGCMCLQGAPTECGEGNEACCGGTTCYDGVCSNETCQCGAQGQGCCSNLKYRLLRKSRVHLRCGLPVRGSESALLRRLRRKLRPQSELRRGCPCRGHRRMGMRLRRLRPSLLRRYHLRQPGRLRQRLLQLSSRAPRRRRIGYRRWGLSRQAGGCTQPSRRLLVPREPAAGHGLRQLDGPQVRSGRHT